MIRINKSLGKRIFDIIILFMFIFDIALINVPTIFSTRKISFFFMVIFYLRKDKKDSMCIRDKNILHIWLMVNGMMWIYVFIISCFNGVLGHTSSIMPRYSYFITFTIIGTLLFVSKYENEYQFMNDVIYCMVVQSVVVYAEFLSKNFKRFLSNNFIEVGNVSFLRNDRATGLGAEGAYLTLLFFIGVFCCNYIILTCKMNIKYVIFQIIFIGASFFVGRTGIYISVILICLTFVFMMMRSFDAKKMLKFVATFGIFGGIGIGILKNSITIEQMGSFLERLLSLFGGMETEKSLQIFSKMKVPQLCYDTIVGTGIFRGFTPNGLTISHDSGYVQVYFAFGLILAIIFYMCMFIVILKLLKCDMKMFNIKIFYFLIFALIIFCVEIKEPFIFKYIMPLCLMCFICLYHKGMRTVKYEN